ncbi:MAG: hypothetical protein JRH20_19710 [Deltaproteobacteria bacterium]|nr:hypothetical protein [Deltaproteobacteria bacterium]
MCRFSWALVLALSACTFNTHGPLSIISQDGTMVDSGGTFDTFSRKDNTSDLAGEDGLGTKDLVDGTPQDASVDAVDGAQTDTVADSTWDTLPPDGTTDATTDAISPDARVDTTLDLSPDTTPDTTWDSTMDLPPDATWDSTVDLPPDTSADITVDLLPDTSADITVDLLPDTTVDAPPSSCLGIFGTTDFFQLCEENWKTCLYYVELGNTYSCTDFCVFYGTRCAGSFDEGPDNNLCAASSGDRGCDDISNDRLCECRK